MNSTLMYFVNRSMFQRTSCTNLTDLLTVVSYDFTRPSRNLDKSQVSVQAITIDILLYIFIYAEFTYNIYSLIRREVVLHK